MGNEKDNEDTTPQIGAVKAIKLPTPFWRNNPVRYFNVVEATFSLHGIKSDNTMFQHLMVNLEADILDLVGDIIDKPPETDKYETLKNRILNALGDSQETKLRKLLRGQQMGDEKPSVYLQKMRSQAGDIVSEELLKQLFLEQLPENVRSILAINKADTKVDDLATMADRIVETIRSHIAAVHQDAISSNPTPSSSRGATPKLIYEELTEQRMLMAALSKRVDDLQVTCNKLKHRRSRSRTRNRSISEGKQRNDSLCYFHEKFGKNAYRCRQPCSFKLQTEN